MAACFEWKDDVIYDELHDVEPATAVVKGQGAVRQDVFGFYAKDRESSGEEVTLIYKCRQVLANKRTGSGEAIVSGDKLYYYPSDEKVSPVATGTAGTDYYYCGTAKQSASASATTVLMRFDGTRHTEDI